MGGLGKKRGRPRHSSAIGLDGSCELDRSSKVSLYYQLGEILKQKLEAGAWDPGTLFPSERELETQFRVSRSVTRPALELLERDGAIYRIRGKGTFVSPPKSSAPIGGLIRLLLDPHSSGLTISVIQVRDRCEDRIVAEVLKTADRPRSVGQVTAVVHLEKPIFVLDSYFSVEQVPWLLAAARSVRDGVGPCIPADLPTLTRAQGTIEGSSCGPWTASQLGILIGDPALVGRLVQCGVPAGGGEERPIELTRIVARSDISKFHFEVS